MLLLLMLLGCLLLLLWLVSLLILLLRSNPTQPLPSAHGYEGERKNVLLVIAHPDDESMFFTPTLLSLASLGLYRVHVLCLSTGNAEGLGTIRKQELVSACSLLKVPEENVEVLDDPALQDGHNVIWSQNLIQQKLEAAMSKLKIDIMITFDEYGVSGHPNHSAVYRGVCVFLLEAAKHVGDQEKLNIEAWTLESVDLLKKYCGPVSFMQLMGNKKSMQKDKVHSFNNREPHRTIIAMRQHATQWLWYRRLFVIFSYYTYMNTLRRIEI